MIIILYLRMITDYIEREMMIPENDEIDKDDDDTSNYDIEREIET